MNRWPLPLVLLASFACSDGAPPSDAPEDAGASEAPQASAPEAESPARVIIQSPASGAEVEGPVVEVTLGVENLTIVPAGEQQPNSGHHHLFLDADVSPAGEPMPAEPGRIVHMGDGSSTYRFENVAPGEHRLIAVIGDWQHVPLVPNVADTVTFTVR